MEGEVADNCCVLLSHMYTYLYNEHLHTSKVHTHACHMLCMNIVSPFSQHENASVKMFDHLVEVNNLQPFLERYDITEGDLTFVKEQIAGPVDTEQCSSQMQTVSEHLIVVK